MTERLKPFLVRFPARVLGEVHREARSRGVSSSQLVRTAVREYLGGGKKRERETPPHDGLCDELVREVKKGLLSDEEFLSAIRRTRDT